MQNIGFYPEQGWKVAFTNAPVPGKFVDNSNHEYNASLLLNISPDQLHRALDEIRYLAGKVLYDIDEYNCTDFALDVINCVRAYKLDIPRYDIPGGITAGGTATPQGLFHKLAAMKKAEGPEAGNISLPGVKGFVANSNGPCN